MPKKAQGLTHITATLLGHTSSNPAPQPSSPSPSPSPYHQTSALPDPLSPYGPHPDSSSNSPYNQTSSHPDPLSPYGPHSDSSSPYNQTTTHPDPLHLFRSISIEAHCTKPLSDVLTDTSLSGYNDILQFLMPLAAARWAADSAWMQCMRSNLFSAGRVEKKKLKNIIVSG